MLKIRRPLGRLIFNMGIAIPGKTVFLIETAPWPQCVSEKSTLLDAVMTSSSRNISRVTGEIPAQRPVVKLSFGVFFDLRLNKWLSKQSWGWWFETRSRPLLRHWNDWAAPQEHMNYCFNKPFKASWTLLLTEVAKATLIMAWISNYIGMKLCSIITQPCFNLNFVEIMAWIRYGIRQEKGCLLMHGLTSAEHIQSANVFVFVWDSPHLVRPSLHWGGTQIP